MTDAPPLPPGDLLDAVRVGCAAVAAGARHVAVRAEGVEAVARGLLDAEIPPLHDPAHAPLATEAATVAFVLQLDAINFGSGWFADLAPPGAPTPYLDVAGALRAHAVAHEPLPADALARVTPEDARRLLGLPGTRVGQELAARYAASWRGLGAHVRDAWGGRFDALVADAGGRAEPLVRRLAGLPGWRDVARWRGREVPLLKRAQITVADLHLALGGAGLGRFDVERLTVFADDLVPHVLRVDGALALSDDLAAHIDRGELLAEGDEGEVELRACAVHAAERVVARLGALGRPVTALWLDQVLWRRGQAARYAGARHRCATSAY